MRQHGETAMNEKPRVVGATSVALRLSDLVLAFGVCYVAPWAVTLLGVAGAVLLARLAFSQPAGDLEKVRLTNDSSRAALEWADRLPSRKNNIRSSRRPSASAAFCNE